jgi:hypothetical protein
LGRWLTVASGVRNALDNAANRAVESRHAEVIYLTSQLVTGCIVETALWIGRRLSR